MSHELRTPLNSVLGYAQLLRSQAGLSEEQRKALRIIQGAGEHLLELIEDFLDMSKVEDTGIGIGPEHLAEIFEVFHQVRDPARYAEGTGLGLAICKRLVRLMGGELEVSSTLGEGSRFWFDLALPPASGATAPASRRIIGVEGPRRRVLVVDDEADNRALMRDLLAPLGFELHEAADGEEGYAQAQALKPDAILMDMRMPRLDGLGAIRRIRAARALQDTVIIAISASAFEHNRAHCIEAGTDDFLPKPFRRERLLDPLRMHLGLTLRYAEGETEIPRASPHALETLPPPAEHLHGLLATARRGDLEACLEQARALALEGLDARHAPFAAEARRLAEGFQMKRLRQWLEGLSDSP